MTSLRERWEIFRQTLTPFPTLDRKTQNLVRSAWYAGAASGYEACLDASLMPTEDAGEAALRALRDELVAYASELANSVAGPLAPGGRA
jgi:hypothetical protein